jgi:hypothetical protein
LQKSQINKLEGIAKIPNQQIGGLRGFAGLANGPGSGFSAKVRKVSNG